jgi:D-alanyl-D-alanine carboxypeptidase (penicillin-binding protein 5/6)
MNGLRWTRRIAVALAILAAMVPAVSPPSASAVIPPPAIKAPSALLMTMNGAGLWSRTPLTKRAVASTIKMLNALVVRDSVNMTEVVTVPRKAMMWNGGVGLVAGQKFTVQQLLTMMLVASANDAAEAVALHIGGTQSHYVALMNAKAKALGLTGTHASDPHGLSEHERSTAQDLSTLARTVMADPVLRSIVSKRSVTVTRRNKKTVTYKSTDALLGHYTGMEGVKTGYTSASGYCFVGAAKRGGVELLGVVMHTKSNADRFGQMRKLLDWGFKHCHMRLLVSADATMGAVAVDGAATQMVTLHAARETSAALLDGGTIETSVSLPATVTAPVTRGQQLGTVRVSRDGVLVVSVPLLADADVPAAPLLPEVFAAWGVPTR